MRGWQKLEKKFGSISLDIVMYVYNCLHMNIFESWYFDGSECLFCPLLCCTWL